MSPTSPTTTHSSVLAQTTASHLLELLRVTQATPLDPEKVRTLAEAMEQSIGEWLTSDHLRIGVEGNHLTFNDIAPRIEQAEFLLAARYCERWKQAGVGGIVFMKNISAKDLTKLFLLPFNPKAKAEPNWLKLQLPRHAPNGEVQFLPPRRAALPAFYNVEGQALFAKLVLELGHIAELEHRTPAYHESQARLRRLVEELTDFSVQAERLLALVLLCPPELPQATELVQTSMLAVLFGQGLGLGRTVLAELGLAALLYDLGFVHAPPPQGKERTPFSALTTLKLLCRSEKLEISRLQWLVIAMEQHKQHARQASQTVLNRPYLLSRIVAICRGFVQLLRGGLGPSAALASIAGGRANQFDSALVAVLIHLLGPVPVGTLVQLKDWEPSEGLVCGHWRDRAGRRQPWVLELDSVHRRIKALLTEPATGDEQLPRVHGVARHRFDGDLLLKTLFPQA